MTILRGFEWTEVTLNEVKVAFAKGGAGPPVLLLHGFPQTHAMWHAIAPQLAQGFTVVAPDLRGYGASGKPEDPAAYSFRAMAADPLALMSELGFDTFHLVGHDRGGRVAHRMALDAPERIKSLTVMDIVPTHHLLADLRAEVAKAYYHWFFLAQPAPFPETMIAHDPDAYYQSCLLGWGAAQLSDFAHDALAAYRLAWRDPETIRGMCSDYRATLTLDFDIDSKDLHKTIDAPSLVLFGAQGAMADQYDVAETWAPRLTNMQAAAIPGGHFFPDQSPEATGEAVLKFLKSVR